MTWIDTKDGWVNLTTARDIQSNAHGHHFIIDADGNRHQLSWEWGKELLEQHLAPVIPEERDIRIHIISVDGQETFVETFPVIGWRLFPGYAEPIVPLTTPDYRSADLIAVVETLDGKFHEVKFEGSIFESLDEAREHLKKRANPKIAKFRDDNDC
jgi:hypothetical protein